MVGKTIVNVGKVVRPSQLVRSVRQTVGSDEGEFKCGSK